MVKIDQFQNLLDIVVIKILAMELLDNDIVCRIHFLFLPRAQRLADDKL